MLELRDILSSASLVLRLKAAPQLPASYTHFLKVPFKQASLFIFSYGETFFACFKGANAGTRCTRGEKMQIRILNDMNPNALHKPVKPSKSDLEDYISG